MIVNSLGVTVKGKETRLQIQQVTTRDKRRVVLLKVTKQVYIDKTKQFLREDVSEPFWIDSLDMLIDALVDYRNILDEKGHLKRTYADEPTD